MKSVVFCLLVICIVACNSLRIAKSNKPSRCGSLCKIYCPNGNVLDSRGCPICECKPQVCPRRYCPRKRECTNGYKTDRKGCKTCTCKSSSEKRSCRYNGKTYRDGKSFMKDCNRCLCRNGRAACTRKACRPQALKESCRYNGRTYQHGTNFMKKHNRCSCRNGRVGCTRRNDKDDD